MRRDGARSSQNPEDPRKEENQKNGGKWSRRVCVPGEEVSGERQKREVRVYPGNWKYARKKGRNGGECYTACEKNEAANDEGDDAGTSATTRI